MYIRGKPFSSAQRLLLYIIAGTTAINVVHCGFVWTIFFVCISAFLGSAAFLLVIDKREGGLVVEIRKFLQMYDFPVRSWLQLLRANALSTSETFETVEKSKGIGLMATPPQLSSHSLEKIYPWLNLSIPKVQLHALEPTRCFNPRTLPVDRVEKFDELTDSKIICDW